jgi:hypothetical protein
VNNMRNNMEDDVVFFFAEQITNYQKQQHKK